MIHYGTYLEGPHGYSVQGFKGFIQFIPSLFAFGKVGFLDRFTMQPTKPNGRLFDLHYILTNAQISHFPPGQERYSLFLHCSFFTRRRLRMRNTAVATQPPQPVPSVVGGWSKRYHCGFGFSMMAFVG